jgi:Immunity protein 10
MPISAFDAVTIVTVEENQDAVVVGLAEHDGGDGACLIFQCSPTPPSTSDIATGLDTYCLLAQDGAIHYGGVTHAVLEPGRLTLKLTDEAARELGVEDATNTVTLSIPPRETGRLADGLRRILTYGHPTQMPELIGI